ncbi:jg26614, partial [Pararge aegeria aegeria]
MFVYAFICVFIGSTIGFHVDKEAPPQWSDVYTIKGILNIPYAELHEPFYAWFDSKNGKSRIDYYGAMVKTYQLAASVYPEFGTSIKIAPVTTEKVQNQDTCLQVNGTKGESINVQTVLPDMTDFKYVGEYHH